MSRLSAWGIALVLVGASMPVASGGATDSAVHQVTIERDSFAFAPQALSIHQGDTVRWNNHDGQLHMIVTAKPDSNGRELELYKKVEPGGTMEYQFNTAAAYYYYCAIHFQMWGIISVNP